MSAFKTDQTATICPFGDVAVEVDYTVDLATCEIEINDCRIDGTFFEHKVVFFQDGKDKYISFADRVYQGLLTQAEDNIGDFGEAIRETRAESRREAREDR